MTEDAPFPAGFFARADESDDALFYQQPRLVTHIDDATIAGITAYYAEQLFAGAHVLDLMSSWISHLPDEPQLGHVAGHGMNAQELDANPRLHERVVQNLNEQPTLPWDDERFDFAMIVVSIQYLTRPVEVFAEIGRVLKPGGRLIVSMSHRCFPTKAIRAFQALGPQDRIRLVADYFRRAGNFENAEFIDRSPQDADPLWIVTGLAM